MGGKLKHSFRNTYWICYLINNQIENKLLRVIGYLKPLKIGEKGTTRTCGQPKIFSFAGLVFNY
jgi:hypothetical protein